VEEKCHVIVVAATNRLDILDKAILRPGRFDRLISVPLPDIQAREEILRINCKKMHNTLKEEDFEELSKSSEGMSGAEMALVCREAGLKALTTGGAIESDADIFVGFSLFQAALAEV